MNGRGARVGRSAAMLALCLGASSACRRAPQVHSKPAPSASAATDRALPALEIQQAQYDFGALVQGTAASHVFEISNAGRAPLELESHTEALGCTGELDRSALPPGESGHLNVTCRPEFYGPLLVTLALRSAKTSETLSQVELKASVTPLLTFDTPLVSLQMPFGEERTVDVHAQGALADRAKLTLESAGDAGFNVTPLPAANGAPARLRLRVKGRKVGVHVGNIVLTTNLARPRRLSLLYSCEVVGSLAVTPSTPYFDLRVPGAAVREVAVSSSQPGFALHAVRIAEGPFSASFARGAAPGEYTVTVAVELDKIQGDARGSLGRLLILSNDRAEPEKELPLFAFGAPTRVAAD
ncbi:MAG TPA: DUF1573 domain-containing protein [Polyangiaceae bacterium]